MNHEKKNSPITNYGLLKLATLILDILNKYPGNIPTAKYNLPTQFKKQAKEIFPEF